MKRFIKLLRSYSLRKSKGILFHTFDLYQKRKKRLSDIQRMEIEKHLLSLQKAITEKERIKADTLARELEGFIKKDLKKSGLIQARDFIFALAFALVIAVIVRGMWFELYEIPSGSMRPTFKEKDRLTVSKTDFGLNIPLMADHFYFDPTLVNRNGVVVFTVENMDVRDGDTVYFYLFPGKKQYIKRLIGKPGDSLYFYGGKIYGIDKEGNDITHELQIEGLAKIDHIPFIQMEGKIEAKPSSYAGIYSPVTLLQMNQPVAKLFLNEAFKPQGEMLVADVKEYSELWGFKNFAMARLLTKEEANISNGDEALLYLELKHSPSLSDVSFGQDPFGRLRPLLGITTSLIPLNETHLKEIFQNLYTARFVVKNGVAKRYGIEEVNFDYPALPKLSGIPNGTYEFYEGKAYAVAFGGVLKELAADHPLYTFTPERVQLLYNLGIEFNTHYAPSSRGSNLSPNRYSYFREGNLYLMGVPILKKDEATLTKFLEKEKEKPHPFIDQGAPLDKEGKLDTDYIKKYGITVPEKMYLVLGDNHAMSADSRDFGFVPEENLRGGPDFIFWPPGSRWGAPNQPAYTLFTLPRVLVWGSCGLILAAYILYRRRKHHLPLDL